MGGADSLRRALVRGGLGSFTLKIADTVLRLAISIVLARALAPEGYGTYAFAFSVMTLLSIPVQLGLPLLLVRQVARYHYHAEWGLLRGMLQLANRAVFAIAVVLALIAGTLLWAYRASLPAELAPTFAWTLLLLPLVTLLKLQEATVRGLRRVVAAQVPTLVLFPGLFLVFLVMGATWDALSPPRAMSLYCAAAGLALVLAAAIVARSLPPGLAGATPEYRAREWLSSMLPLSLLAGMQILNSNTDLFMLGVLSSSANVGEYRVAVSGANLVVFMLAAVNQVVAPHAARLHSAGDHVRLQRMVTVSARVVLLSSLPAALVFILFGRFILGFVFGPEYTAAYPALAILCVGQLVNATMGSVGILLNMSGHERDTVRGVAVGFAANVVLNAVLIPPFGIVGAATATASATVIWNLLLHRTVWKRLGIQSSALGRVQQHRRDS